MQFYGKRGSPCIIICRRRFGRRQSIPRFFPYRLTLKSATDSSPILTFADFVFSLILKFPLHSGPSPNLFFMLSRNIRCFYSILPQRRDNFIKQTLLIFSLLRANLLIFAAQVMRRFNNMKYFFDPNR